MGLVWVEFKHRKTRKGRKYFGLRKGAKGGSVSVEEEVVVSITVKNIGDRVTFSHFLQLIIIR